MKTLAALFLLLGAASQDEVTFEKDIVYGKGGDVDLTLSLSRPKNAEKALPCIVVIHGGGWARGRKENHDAMIRQFAKLGYVSVTVGYRFAPEHVFPAQVEDVKCAVRFLRANAGKYGIIPDRIGAVGFSAGGHLSMMLGVMGKGDGLEGRGGHADQDSQVNAVVSFFGPTDLFSADYPPASRKILAAFLGGSREEKLEAYRKASPVTYVTKGDAPTLLIQGTKDPLVPHDQVYAMVEAMTKAGVPGRAELLLNFGHGWRGAELKRTLDVTTAFFDKQLKK